MPIASRSILLVWVCLAPQLAWAQDFSSVHFFGDSLSDTGNRCSLLQAFGYAQGRCSNGPVWSDLLADELGFQAEPSIVGGNNFSVGGDTTAELDLQITSFAIRFLNQADPDALYVIWIGGNDVLDLPTAPNAMAEAVNDLVAGIERLSDLGARHFLVPNLPDIGRTFGTFSFPVGSGASFTPQQRDLATLLSVDFNTRLVAALSTLSNVAELDIFGLVETVFADPASFGLVGAAIDSTSDDTSFGLPCLNDLGCAADPEGPVADGFFLFDSIHPTTAMHEVIAGEAAILVPEPRDASWVASFVALGVVLRFRRGRRFAAPCAAGDPGAFPSPSGGHL